MNNLKEYIQTCHVCKTKAYGFLPENYTAEDIYCAELKLKYKHGWVCVTTEDNINGYQFTWICSNCFDMLMKYGKDRSDGMIKFKDTDFNSLVNGILPDLNDNIVGR